MPLLLMIFVGTAFWLFAVWLLWLIYGAVAPAYLTFLPAAWMHMPFWPFAGVLLLIRSFVGNVPSFKVTKS